MTEPISFGRRLADLAQERPDAVAVIEDLGDRPSRRWTWAELDAAATAAAHRLNAAGAGPGRFVVVGLPNVGEHLIATIGAWRLGACVLPLSPKLPPVERDPLLALADPAVIVADEPIRGRSTLGRRDLDSAGAAAGPLPDRVAHPGKAVASGGSTGTSKIIVDPKPWVGVPNGFVATFGPMIGFPALAVQLVTGPLYHNAPFLLTHMGWFEAHTLVIMGKFDAERVVGLIERHRVTWCLLVPTMMHRVMAVPGLRDRDLSSLEAVYHTAAPCPPSLKQAWIDLVGATRVYEAYGSTENVGAAVIRGDEWLLHRGSVGRPYQCDARIQDDAGRPLPPGTIGEIFMRPRQSADRQYEYVGAAPARSTRDGFVSVGDLGWLDADGYLYIADRRTDLIITGGVNVYPAEVEAALLEHPSVRDAAVIGLPEPEWGKRVHAVIELAAPATAGELDRHCHDRLTAAKLPRTYEFVSELPRNEAGKIRRSALVAERSGPTR